MDAMPQSQQQLIDKIEEHIAKNTNYENPNAFAFRVWQNREFLLRTLREFEEEQTIEE